MSFFLSFIKRVIIYFQELYRLFPLSDFYKVAPWNKVLFPGHYFSLKILALNKIPAVMRIGTSDYPTLKSTFLKQYHLPHMQLPDNSIILDLGCNVGYTVMHFAYLYPNAKIIGVEMDCDNFSLSKRNTDHTKNCVLLNKAISTSNTVVSYNKKTNEDAYKILSNKELFNDEGDNINIEAITINSLISQFNLKRIDYVKMDIEGEEVRIFDESLCDLSWLDIVEMLNIEIHTNSSDLQKIKSVLERHHFIAWNDERHWSTIRAIRK